MSGSGYLVAPNSDSGPGILVLGSWYGLNDGVRDFCNRLADAGFVSLAPDLVGEERTTDDPDTARLWLAGRDINEVADLVVSSATMLRDTDVTPDAPIGVLGLQMGASWALWLASRYPDLVGVVSFYYGSQDVDRLDVTCAVQGHFAEDDELVDDDTKTLLSAALHLVCDHVEGFDYAGTKSGFAEPGPTFDADAAAQAWNRTLTWFSEHLRR